MPRYGRHHECYMGNRFGGFKGGGGDRAWTKAPHGPLAGFGLASMRCDCRSVSAPDVAGGYAGNPALR